MTSGSLGPLAAALAASCAVAACSLRRPGVLEDLVPDAAGSRRTVVDRVGSTALVRVAVGGPRLTALLESAGSSVPADRIAGVAALVATCVGLVALRLGSAVSLAAVFGVIVMLRAPAFVAARAARRRLRAIERDVPLLLDVLALASFAGLPPPAALRRAVSAIDGPLAEELSAALGDVELGARWRNRLTRVAEELPIPDLRRAIALLVRSESIGASTTEPISILADDVRATRRTAASERARKAPVQMLFPLVFLVLPAFLLLTVVPVLVATLGSIR